MGCSPLQAGQERQLTPLEVTLTLTGPINTALVAAAFGDLTIATKKGATRIHLLIQSGGGVIDDGIALYNFIRALPVEVVAHNSGGVSSIAVIAFLAAKVRRASKTAQFMIHKTHWQASEVVTAEKASRLIKNLSANDERVESILREHIHMPASKWKAHKAADLYISAEQALEYGIIHEIQDFVVPSPAELWNIKPA